GLAFHLSCYFGKPLVGFLQVLVNLVYDRAVSKLNSRTWWRVVRPCFGRRSKRTQPVAVQGNQVLPLLVATNWPRKPASHNCTPFGVPASAGFFRPKAVLQLVK